jgi:hypothetical protein
MNTNESWFSRGKAEAEKGIPFGERVVGIALVVLNVMMLWYFVAHQTRATGFFTPTFGKSEMVMLYGLLILGMISAGLEGVFGKRLYSRIFDVFGGLLLAAVFTIWLLVLFPFDFAYFADVSPESLSFLLRWISNDIARVLMVLAIIVYLGAAAYCPIAYGFVSKRESKRENVSV